MTYALGEADVHVWRAALDRPPDRVAALAALLSPDERDRAARFHFARDRRRYTVGRGVLRRLLGAYLGVPGDGLVFSYGPQGKPALASGDLRFNLAHTGAVALYAVTRRREVGVDIEGFRPDFATDEIAERFFSDAERRALRALAPAERCRAFFSCWARKEAYIKALGGGLSIPLDGFDVSLAPGEPAALLATRPIAADAARWTLAEIEAGPDAAAALAVEGRGWRLTVRDCRDD